MKRLLLFVFLCLMVVPVRGMENDSIILKYKYYRLNKVLGPYVLKDEASDEFPFIDKTVYTQSKLSKPSPIKPDEEDRIIYEYDGFQYLEEQKINNIEIVMGINSSASDITISVNGENIDYEHNNDDDVIDEGETVIFKLDDEYYLEDLLVSVRSGSFYKNKFDVNFKHDDIIVSKNVCSCLHYYNFKIDGKSSQIYQTSYKTTYSLEKIDDKHFIYDGEIKLYQYSDKLYQSYKLEREYYDQYLNEPFQDFIYRDDNDYIVIENSLTDKVLDNSNNSTGQATVDFMGVDVPQKKVNKTFSKSINTNNKIVSQSNNNNLKRASKYQQILKVNNSKPPQSSIKAQNNVYYILKLLLLLILLILTIKIGKKIKEYSR